MAIIIKGQAPSSVQIIDVTYTEALLVRKDADGGDVFVVDTTNGRVGIGAGAPAQALDISAGSIQIDITTFANQDGIIYKGADRFIHDFNYGDNGTVTTDGVNTFVGVDAGNFIMGSTATQTYHASYNTAHGYQSLYSNTTGYSNTAQGYQSLYSNTPGYSNTAQGDRSLYSNTTGASNTAHGYQSLYNNTGGNNCAQGANAGRYIADGSTANQTTNNSVFIGFDTKASADGVTNENVFGYNATGIGSNTVTLGDDNIVTTALKGNVGIGVTTFGTNAVEVLGINADGTVPSTSPAGMIQIFADDSSGGAANATLAIRTEEAIVTEALVGDSTLNIWVNGIEYHLLLRAV